jgi:3-hydroxyacyl-[acyl-carrier-protein] dehydratase
VLDINDIMKVLPHRYPLLLVDKVEELVEFERVVAIKNVTMNEQFFQGHFPKRPVMPGVLILEAMAQACGILAFRSQGREELIDQIVLLVGVDNVRFKRPVVPGDQLRLEGVVDKIKRGIWIFKVSATVDGERAAEASIMCTLKDV